MSLLHFPGVAFTAARIVDCQPLGWAFTLVELLVATAVGAVLAGAVLLLLAKPPPSNGPGWPT